MPERRTGSAAETEAVARELATTLAAGDVVLLTGDLGSGKTTFVRGLAEGLGLDGGDVSSPTFTLVHEHRGGRLTLYHADLYRLDASEAADLGLDEIGAGDGVLAIEWPDRLTHVRDGACRVSIETTGDETRLIRWSIVRVSASGLRAD